MSAENPRYCALILAGRRSVGAPDAVAASVGLPVKALVPVNGRRMLDRVIGALRESGRVAEINVCLPEDLDLAVHARDLADAFADGRLIRVAPAESPSASVRQFVAAHVGDQPVLVTTADHALLTPGMLQQFLDEVDASGADAAVGLADADEIAAAYPGSHRTKLKLRDGRFTGCNLFAFKGRGALELLSFWKRIDQHRKQPWRLARALGLSTLLLYSIGSLSLRAAMTRLGRVSGARLHAVRMRDLHAGIDVDTLKDLDLANRILARREGSVERGPAT